MGFEDFENIDAIEANLQEELENVQELGNELNIICKAAKDFKSNQVGTLIKKANYRIGNLQNASKFSDVASQEEIDNNKTELSTVTSSLSKEKDSLDVTKSLLTSTEFKIEKYQEIVNQLVEKITYGMELANETIDKSNDILINGVKQEVPEEVKETKEEVKEEEKLESFLEEPEVEKYEIKEEPTLVIKEEEAKEDTKSTVIDDLDRLGNILNDEIYGINEATQSLKEAKAQLEEPKVEQYEINTVPTQEPKEDLNNIQEVDHLDEEDKNADASLEEIKVIEEEPAPLEITESVITPVEEQSLGDILNNDFDYIAQDVPNEIAEGITETYKIENEINNKTVDDEPIKVVAIEDFSKVNAQTREERNVRKRAM